MVHIYVRHRPIKTNVRDKDETETENKDERERDGEQTENGKK